METGPTAAEVTEAAAAAEATAEEVMVVVAVADTEMPVVDMEVVVAVMGEAAMEAVVVGMAVLRDELLKYHKLSANRHQIREWPEPIPRKSTSHHNSRCLIPVWELLQYRNSRH